jgi:hypothetical protein
VKLAPWRQVLLTRVDRGLQPLAAECLRPRHVLG